MSYIKFESAREKDRARQELREARDQMLEEAKRRFEKRAEREVNKCLKGETNWMLPSVEEKLMTKSKGIKIEKKKKDKKKRSKKRSKINREISSSDSDSDTSESDSSSENTSSSSSERERKKRQKSKKIRKKSKKRKRNRKPTSSDSEESRNEKVGYGKVNVPEEPLTRDSWMTSPLMLKTYTKEKLEKKPNESQQIDAYDPVKSNRELNPYWKTTGTGLPSFLKPKDVDDDSNIQTNRYKTSSSKNWKKRSDEKIYEETKPSRRNKSFASVNKYNSSSEDNNDENNKNDVKSSSASTLQFLTDQEMNELGAKVLKAELMGNMLLADKLREELENARKQRNLFKESQKQAYKDGNSKQDRSKCNKEDEHIILTRTDQAGCTRPLPPSKVWDPKDMYGGNRKQKQKTMQTHNKNRERERYFADDDRYSIKEMFEKEKYKSSADVNSEFANIMSKHKNPNDDMEDIFCEKICKDDSFHLDQKERNRAIREHQKIEATLDNCTKCIDSTKMQKELLVCVGEKVYLALPWYQGLQDGHCLIIPNQHTTCCTQIDEDTWTEINDFRKALTRMFSAQRKDVIFFEIANRLHNRPHLVIHCIPIRETDGEMAPFYFKKAIEESEHEWSVNKQLVSLRNKCLRSCIPKGLPYFWVNFGMDTGFAHVIEDEERFPANFAQEIIGGMLNLDARKWRKLQKENNIITKVKIFADFWKKYDCTKS